MRAARSAASVPVSYPSRGLPDSPRPRWSGTMTWNCRASAGITSRQAYQVWGQPWTGSSGGPSPPLTTCWRRPPALTWRLVNVFQNPRGSCGARCRRAVPDGCPRRRWLRPRPARAQRQGTGPGPRPRITPRRDTLSGTAVRPCPHAGPSVSIDIITIPFRQVALDLTRGSLAATVRRERRSLRWPWCSGALNSRGPGPGGSPRPGYWARDAPGSFRDPTPDAGCDPRQARERGSS